MSAAPTARERRIDALEFAVQAYPGEKARDITDAADVFLAWLDGEAHGVTVRPYVHVPTGAAVVNFSDIHHHTVAPL